MTVQTSVIWDLDRKTERDGAEVTESGRVFQKRLPITGKARCQIAVNCCMLERGWGKHSSAAPEGWRDTWCTVQDGVERGSQHRWRDSTVGAALQTVSSLSLMLLLRMSCVQNFFTLFVKMLAKLTVSGVKTVPDTQRCIGQHVSYSRAPVTARCITQCSCLAL